MTKTKLHLAAALLAAGLVVSLSVVALAQDEEPDGAPQDPPAAVADDDLDAEERRHLERELAAVPWDEIRLALAGARDALAGIDAGAIQAEIEAAMAEIDLDEIRVETRAALDDVDWDEIRRDVEAARVEIQDIDLNEIRAEVDAALDDVDWDEIRRSVEEAQGLAAEELEAVREMLDDLEADGAGAI